jgi:hypothetical protein
MTDEDKKRIVSEPPPHTDEIDDEWGDDDETLVRDAPSLSDPPKVSVRPSAATASAPLQSASAGSIAVAKTEPTSAATASATTPVPDAPASPGKTAAAPLSGAPEHDDDEHDDDEHDDDEHDDDEHDDDEHDEVSQASQDWIPDWAPFAVLGVLVSASILLGLGLLGGPPSSDSDGEVSAEQAEQAAPAPSALKAPRPMAHP